MGNIMVIEKLTQIINLSNQLMVAINLVGSENESEDVLDDLKTIEQARKVAFMALFEGYSLDELQPHLTLLQQAVDLDFELKDLALQKKGVMAKAVIQQKNNTKATNAYLSK